MKFFSILVPILLLGMPTHTRAQTGRIGHLVDLPLEDLLEITIATASKTDQKLTQAPAIISVITARQIETRGYRSIAEVLQNVPGFDLITDHLLANIGLRGINSGMQAWSRNVKIMIDGQAIAFRPSTENWLNEDLFPISAVEQIEIVRGPASVLYGANAFLGVVNIITKSSRSGHSRMISARAGSTGGELAYGGELVYTRKLGHAEFLLAGAGSRSDRSGLSPQNIPDHVIYAPGTESVADITRPKSFFAKLSYQTESFGKLTLDGFYQNLDSGGEFQSWGVLTGRNRINLTNFYVRSKYSRPIGDHLTGNASVAVSQGKPGDKEHLAINLEGFADWLTRSVKCSGLDMTADATYSFRGQNRIIFGFDYTRDRQAPQTFYRHTGGQPTEPTDLLAFSDTTFSQTGLYAQTILYPFQLVEAQFLSELGLTLGLRYDAHNIYNDVWTSRIAGVFPITRRLNAKILYGTSFKAPSAVELYTNFMIPGGLVGNPELAPEKARTFEAALSFKVTPDVFFSWNGYINRIKNKVELVRSTATQNDIPANISEIESAGFETELLVLKNNWSSYLNASYQDSRLKKADLWDPRQQWVVRTRLYPSVMTKFGLTCQIPAYLLYANVEGRYIGPRRASEQNISIYDTLNNLDAYALDAYFVADVTLGTMAHWWLSIGEAQLRLKINNILNQEYAYPGFKDFDIPGLGRTFSFEITQNF